MNGKKLFGLITVLVLVILTFSLTGCGQQNSSQQPAPEKQANQQPQQQKQDKAPTEVRVTYLSGTQKFPMAVMLDRKIDLKHGIKVVATEVSGPPAAYTRMKAGEADISFGGWESIAVFRSQNIDWFNAFPLVTLYNDIMVKKDSPIKDIADLKGKKIGFYGGPSGTSTLLTRALIAKDWGFDIDKESKVFYQAAPLLMGMLDKGELDAVLMLDPLYAKNMVTGNYRSIGNISDLYMQKEGKRPLLVNVNVSGKFAKSNPEALKNFITALKESEQVLRDDLSVWTTLAKNAGIEDPKAVDLLRQRVVPSYVADWDDKIIQEQVEINSMAIKALGKNEGLPDPVPQGTFDNKYLP